MLFINPGIILPKLHSTTHTKNYFQHKFPIYERKIRSNIIAPKSESSSLNCDNGMHLWKMYGDKPPMGPNWKEKGEQQISQENWIKKPTRTNKHSRQCLKGDNVTFPNISRIYTKFTLKLYYWTRTSMSSPQLIDEIWSPISVLNAFQSIS